MNAPTNDIYDSKQEHREQREQADHTCTFSRSQPDKENGNSENKIIDPFIKRPCFMTHTEQVKSGNKILMPGLYYHSIEHGDDGRPTNIDEWLCSPLLVDAISSSTNGGYFGRLLRFTDSNGHWHEWAMPMNMLKSSGDDLLGELLSQGVVFDRKKRSAIMNYIMKVQPEKKITAASKTGWFEDVFVLPNRIIGNGNVIYQSEYTYESDVESNGTLEDWNQQIGRLCAGNIPLMVSVCAALAGPLFKLVNRKQGSGIHWVGDLSIGKSTALEVAASVWGPPDFIRSWSTTANGLEGIAATRNDTCLILDEINEASPQEIGKIVYIIVNGSGKQRAGRNGNARKIQRWRLMALSSGERTLENIMNEAGKKTNAGQIVRLLNVDAIFEHGILSNLHEFNDGQTLADHLKIACQKHYGQLGTAFIDKLISTEVNIIELLNTIAKKLIEPSSTNLEKRAASVFAVIALAGELAINFNLTPWAKDQVYEAILIAFKRWKLLHGIRKTEDYQILEAISDFINKHGDSRFSYTSNITENRPILNRAGWYKNEAGKRIYMFSAAGLQEAGGGFDRGRIVEVLAKHQWLTDTDSDRLTKKTRIGSETKNLYHIYILEQEG